MGDQKKGDSEEAANMPDPEASNETATAASFKAERDAERLAYVKQSLTNVTPTDEQANRIEQLRASAHAFAADLLNFTQSSREQSLAITHLEETVMWGVKAIVLEGRE